MNRMINLRMKYQKLLHLTNLIDVISQKDGIRKEPNTYLRGSKLIYFPF